MRFFFSLSLFLFSFPSFFHPNHHLLMPPTAGGWGDSYSLHFRCVYIPLFFFLFFLPSWVLLYKRFFEFIALGVLPVIIWWERERLTLSRHTTTHHTEMIDSSNNSSSLYRHFSLRFKCFFFSCLINFAWREREKGGKIDKFLMDEEFKFNRLLV